MRRTGLVFTALLTAALAFAPALADAKAGLSSSMGSRGTNTYSAPPATSTAPYTAAPMQRSATPTPSYAPSPGLAAPVRPRSPFMSGLMGGILGAGLFGMMFGGGCFHGLSGIGG